MGTRTSAPIRGGDETPWTARVRSAGPDDGPFDRLPIYANAETRVFAMEDGQPELPWYVYPAGMGVAEVVRRAAGPDGRTAMDCSLFAQLLLFDRVGAPRGSVILGEGGDVTSIARALVRQGRLTDADRDFPVYFTYSPGDNPGPAGAEKDAVSHAYAHQFGGGGQGVWLLPDGQDEAGRPMYVGNEFGVKRLPLDGWFELMTRDLDRVVHPDIRAGLRAPVDVRANWRLDPRELTAAVAADKLAALRAMVSQTFHVADTAVEIWRPNGDGNRAWFVEGQGGARYGDEKELREFLCEASADCRFESGPRG